MKQKRPLVSVCLLTYNHAAYIRQAIDSILQQETSFDWELIIADDCSTDGTRAILEEYQHKHPTRISLLLQPHNVGPEDNWLDLMSRPTSKYVVYCEADDYWTDPAKLQKQADFLESHPSYAICFHPVTVRFEQGEKADALFPAATEGFTIKKLLEANYMQTNSVMYRWRFSEGKGDIKKIFPRGISPGDWYLHLYHAQAGRIGFLPEPMTIYRRHKGGLWWDSEQNIDQIWIRHGLGHLKLFNAMLGLYGTNKERATVIRQHITSLLDTLLRVDQAHGTDLFKQAMDLFPAEVALYARSRVAESKQLIEATALLARKDQDLKDSARVIASRDKRIRALDQQLRLLKDSRIWRTRNAAAKLLGLPEA